MTKKLLSFRDPYKKKHVVVSDVYSRGLKNSVDASKRDLQTKR